MRVGIVGGSGYVGGELLRILLNHEQVEVGVVTSRRNKGEYVFRTHPNLRGLTNMRFSDVDIESLASRSDLVFTALPHGSSAKIVSEILKRGLRVVDLSADFRLKDSKLYELWYNWKHPNPELLQKAVYGLPELHKDEIRKATLVANPGCMAILALAPLVKDDLIEPLRIVVDSKIGSSAGGASPTIFTHHAERYGVIRPYEAGHHRHIAEIEQELSNVGKREVNVAMTPHAVNTVRGILSTCHTFIRDKDITLMELWKVYRSLYRGCPFIRIIRDSQGLQRLPDPKFLIGSNYCDLGFDIDEHSRRIVVFSAIDNLIKGAAGQAVQNMNLMLGFDEEKGLNFPPLHPI
ncbi:MAG: N-acetyl-gamma-glutamyl-phosphate reductase [Candidatus Bathyarchaeia archaeon]